MLVVVRASHSLALLLLLLLFFLSPSYRERDWLLQHPTVCIMYFQCGEEFMVCEDVRKLILTTTTTTIRQHLRTRVVSCTSF